MTIKAIITPFFVMPSSGETFFVAQPGLPRNDKPALEKEIASTLLSLLPPDPQVNIQKLEPNKNENEPPDVFIEVNGKTVGIEITELVPHNRHGQDAALDIFRSRILKLLIPGEQAKNRVIFLHTNNVYPDRLKPTCAKAIATLLNKELASRSERWFVISPPTKPLLPFHTITVETHDLSGHPQLKDKWQPLIVFDTEGTYVVPEEDFPQILSTTVGRKLCHSLSQETWLLVWTKTQAMFGARAELYAHLQKFLITRKCQYSRAFLLSVGLKNEVREVDLSNRTPA